MPRSHPFIINHHRRPIDDWGNTICVFGVLYTWLPQERHLLAWKGHLCGNHSRVFAEDSLKYDCRAQVNYKNCLASSKQPPQAWPEDLSYCSRLHVKFYPLPFALVGFICFV